MLLQINSSDLNKLIMSKVLKYENKTQYQEKIIELSKQKITEQESELT